MEALILAGGLGTRLRPVVSDRPKPVAEVAGRPFIERLLEQLQRYGCKKAVLCVGYRADQIHACLGESFGSLAISYSRENMPLGTAGALRAAVHLVEGNDVMVMNGDSFCDVDLTAFIEAHCHFGGDATMAVLHRENPSQAGVIELDDSNRVVSFAARGTAATPGLINAGVYIFRRDALLAVPQGRQVSLEDEIFPRLMERERLFGWRVGPGFIDIGTPETYEAAQNFFSKPR